MQQLLTHTKHYQNAIIRCLPESQKDKCDSGGMPRMANKYDITDILFLSVLMGRIAG
jgi:hypothetical protein